MRKGGQVAIFFVQRCLIRFKDRLIRAIVGPECLLNATRLTAQVVKRSSRQLQSVRFLASTRFGCHSLTVLLLFVMEG